MSANDEREIALLARKCALLDGFADGCAEGSGDSVWLDKRLEERPFRNAYTAALYQRVWELEEQLRADQIEAAKKRVLFDA